MPKFTDTITIRVKSGNGGKGAVSFHREKYIPKGGPDGGDGGKGGDVYVQADRSYYNLSHLFKDRIYRADNGWPGSGNNKHGRDGADLTIRVPLGTQVINAETGETIADLLEDGARCLVCAGGIGGKGNAFFRSATMQTPRFSQPGMPGVEALITLNLKLIADIGLVGLPNAGKSTLLAAVTNARPKIADYPFTTLVPNLGALRLSDGSLCTIADIPGIIEGAHQGLGLGLSFLQHIERVKIILYVIDITNDDIAYVFQLLREELASYNRALPEKPYRVVLNKTDLIDDKTRDERSRLFEINTVLTVSALRGDGVAELLECIDKLMERKGAA